jgi:hypothetical protein
MKNINVEYDMDENDLDIILRDIVKENKKKPTLAYIFENYSNLLSVFKPHVIKRTLDNIPEAYEYAPNEGEETEKKKKKNEKETKEFEDEPHDIESDPESMKEESNFGNAFDKIMGTLNEDHVPEGDDEGRMALYQLKSMRDKIDRMIGMIQNDDQFEGWVQSKITLADDYITTISDYLENLKKEEEGDDSEPRGSHDMSDDAEALASAGHGTDEDYGYYGGNEDNEEVKEGVVEERRCLKVTGQMQSTRKDKKYMRCARVDGKLKRVHYGDPKLRIKKSNPKRRKSFRARHGCSKAKPGTAKYFSCKNW